MYFISNKCVVGEVGSYCKLAVTFFGVSSYQTRECSASVHFDPPPPLPLSISLDLSLINENTKTTSTGVNTTGRGWGGPPGLFLKYHQKFFVSSHLNFSGDVFPIELKPKFLSPQIPKTTYSRVFFNK